MRKLLLVALCAAVVAVSCSKPRDTARIVGSSTVFPFARTVAERTAAKFDAPSPIVEMTGTGGGLQHFCRGAEGVDIANASRRIKDSERALCRAHGVEAIEFTIGFDGIVAATSSRNPLTAISLRQLYLAVAKDLPGPAGFEPNRFRLWSEIDPALPAIEIEVHGPPPTSGTRDAFVDLALHAGAKAIPELALLATQDPDQFAARAGALREDGRWIDEGENDNTIIQLIRTSPVAIGVFGYSYFDQNRGVVRDLAIEGAHATTGAIANGAYPLARSLHFYVNGAQRRKPVADYVLEFVSEQALGPEGYLTEKGLVPLPREMRRAEWRKAKAFALRRDASPEGPSDD
jgi:phosphate transport system substrate-binding protein